MKDKDSANSKGQMATVVDYSGLDGCGILLMLDDGRLMLPLDGTEALEDCHFGQRVEVNFEEQEAMVSICMAEDFSASIQTLNIVGKESLSWMDQYAISKSPIRIYRCTESSGDFIYIQSAKKSTLYDLSGNEICATVGKAMSDCVRRFNSSKQCLIRQVL